VTWSLSLAPPRPSRPWVSQSRGHGSGATRYAPSPCKGACQRCSSCIVAVSIQGPSTSPKRYNSLKLTSPRESTTSSPTPSSTLSYARALSPESSSPYSSLPTSSYGPTSLKSPSSPSSTAGRSPGSTARSSCSAKAPPSWRCCSKPSSWTKPWWMCLMRC